MEMACIVTSTDDSITDVGGLLLVAYKNMLIGHMAVAVRML